MVPPHPPTLVAPPPDARHDPCTDRCVHRPPVLTVLAVLAAGCGAGPTAVDAPDEAPRKATMLATPPGPIPPAEPTLSVRLLDRLSGQRLSPGRRFEAELAQPLVWPGGAVVLPQGTRLEGRVGRAREASPGLPGAVELVVDRAIVDGVPHRLCTVPASAPLTTPERGLHEPDVVRGVILGAVIGSFVDPWEGTYYFGGAGAAGGAVGSLGHPPADPFVARGTLVTTRLRPCPRAR